MKENKLVSFFVTIVVEGPVAFDICSGFLQLYLRQVRFSTRLQSNFSHDAIADRESVKVFIAGYVQSKEVVELTIQEFEKALIGLEPAAELVFMFPMRLQIIHLLRRYVILSNLSISLMSQSSTDFRVFLTS